MAQYINKDALVAEIERRRRIEVTNNDVAYNGALDEIRHYIGTTNVKDVDLEKEIKDYLHKQPIVTKSHGTEFQLVPSPNEIAKHFFELGLKAKSNWDSVYIEDIDDTLKEMGVDPDSKVARDFKRNYYKALDKFVKEKKLSI